MWASSTVTPDGLMWVTGGGDIDILASTELINSSDSSTISNGVDLPEALSSHEIIILNGTTSILIGGVKNYNGIGSKKTYYFNHMNQTWTPGPDLMYGRYNHKAGVIKDHFTLKEHVVVVGGQTTTSVEIMFNGENDWSTGNV